MRIRYKKGAKDYLVSLPFYQSVDVFDFATFISGKKGKIALEIGVGRGNYLNSMALQHPGVIFIGVEINESVLYVAAKKLVSSNVSNVTIILGDALMFLPKLPEASVDYIILNHSDPWPKTRHSKRRLTYPTFLKEYYRVLKTNGSLLFKTDNDDFAAYSLEQIQSFPFSEVNFEKDYQGDALFDALTEYESKFSAMGVKIKRITGRK